MNKVWFFIASRITWNVEWENIKSDWEKYKGRTPWGIPDGNKDMDKLDRVCNGDTILCYDATPKTAIIGHCKCEGRYNDNPEPDFSNGIYISGFKEYVKPIKLSELRKKRFDFVEDFLGNNNGRGRSIVEVSENDWDKFKKIYYPRKSYVNPLS